MKKKSKLPDGIEELENFFRAHSYLNLHEKHTYQYVCKLIDIDQVNIPRHPRVLALIQRVLTSIQENDPDGCACDEDIGHQRFYHICQNLPRNL